MSKNLFVIGTGTDIGKTYVAGLILKKLKEGGKNAAYYKAAMSGNERDSFGELIPGDAHYVKTISGIHQPISQMCPYVYEQAYSPHLAARLEENQIDRNVVNKQFEDLSAAYELVTLEGSGGILCPLRFDGQVLFLEDLIKEWNMGCLLVADAGLGTINAVGLTAAYLKSRKIPLRGIVFNRFHPESVMEQDNLKMCEYLTKTSVLCCVKEGDTDLDLPLEQLVSLYE